MHSPVAREAGKSKAEKLRPFLPAAMCAFLAHRRMLAKARRGDKGKGKGKPEGSMRRGRFSRYHEHSGREEGDSGLPSQLRARGGGVEEAEASSWGPYAGLLRAHNILPSMFVCMLGAWLGTNDIRHSLLNPTVLLVGE